jgi:transposase InsO family protein
MQTAKLVLEQGWSTRQAARHTGFNQSTIVRWLNRAKHTNRNIIPTGSSRPLHHPNELSLELVARIIEYREKHRRCAEVIHFLLIKDGYQVSLSSVKRTLRRFGLVNHSKWKKWHQYPERPLADKPGILVQIDTIWEGIAKERLYVYTLIDVCSRWAHALPTERINTYRSLNFVKQAQEISPFPFNTLQSDHGSEFSKYFTKRINEYGLTHRHSRVRTPSDNGHLERFNRTLQEECLNRIPRNLNRWKKEIPQYLKWYNTKRPHLALAMKTPLEVMQSY